MLRLALPAFSERFGIQPWDIDGLTYGEAEVYLAALTKEG